MSSKELEALKESLRDTLDWCCGRFKMESLQNSLRSDELKPNADICGHKNFEAIVLDVVSRRHGQVKRKRAVQEGAPLAMGRLLASFPLISLSHGLSVPETGGFINDDEVPPWDSWVYPVPLPNPERHPCMGFLISWVPANLISAVEEAIAINAEESLQWVSDVKHPLVAELKKAGLA
jgi:hypothetical protein